MKPIVYKSRDGLDIHGYLTVPKGVKEKNLPVLCMVHGGPWSRDEWGYDPYAQFFANRGYAVFQMNFRGSTGYGKAFLNAGNKQWGDAMQNDITDGVAVSRQEGHRRSEADRDLRRLVRRVRDARRARVHARISTRPGISYVGPSNIITLLNSIPPYWAVSENHVQRARRRSRRSPRTPSVSSASRRSSPRRRSRRRSSSCRERTIRA